jgi:predicted O-linked N-acetylglucosamine transferase (SPINDLY family)
MSASILHSVGLDRLIFNSLEAYKNSAVYFAENIHELEQLKTLIKRDVLRGTLFNTRKYVQNLEKIFQTMWMKYTNGQPVGLIDLQEEDSDIKKL